ncbi:uncharacterized protein B0P05DRAFT_546944 [Gilbertella persicaria]|uniref:uncharacterized protein n=1 Tax=Gilbertella persicaria TaxID=101096 RepID=UPI00221E72E9|nr:uncharacterized protein B0P05DRAFT_546944 [Gilbertella persicaria]KAI8075923.1 hypothetical protein B0P05DRAFT_546944 [Gilbertella persicaria]
MYIRAKRARTILFLCVEPTNSLEEVKTKLCQALDNKKTSDEVRLFVDAKNKGEYTLLENPKVLENNDVVYFVYFDREEGQWENVNIIEPELLDDDALEEEAPLPPTTTKKEKGKGRA